MMSVHSLFNRFWIALTVLLFTTLVLLYHNGAYAAPDNQTVPVPTPTSEATPVPTATSASNNNDDDDDDDPAPTSTPTEIPPTPTPEGLTATVSVVRLNVRQGPSTEFAVLGVVTNGQTVRVLARNEVGDWWQICCVPGTNTNGWISAQFAQANFDRGQANELLSVVDELPPLPTPTATLDPEQSEDDEFDDPNVENAPLQLQIQQDPPYTWQDQEVDLVYDIANSGDSALLNLELRNELPEALSFIEFVDVAGGTAITETSETETTIFAITWPELASGATETIRVRMHVTGTVADGSVINNLAVVVADNRAAVTAGISIGMPPTTLPDFR